MNTLETHSNDFLEHAMEAWGDMVYRLALSQTRSPVDAEDVMQDVFLRFYNDATAFSSAEHLKAWLIRVTINRCRDLDRMGRKRRTAPLEDEHRAIAAPETDLMHSDVWEAVGELPGDLRAAVHLYYVDGYSTDEIARLLDVNPSTMRGRLRRARTILRGKLAFKHEPSQRKEGVHVQK